MNREATTAPSDILSRARALHDAGKHAEAASVLLRMLGTGAPAGLSHYKLLARIMRALNDPAREALALEQALARSDAHTERSEILALWNRLGAVREGRRDAASALAAYERAAQIGPDDFVALSGIARVKLALQDIDGCRAGANTLQRLFPEKAWSHVLAGHVMKASGEADAAVKCYQRALDCDPTLGEALYNLVDAARPDARGALAARAHELAVRNDVATADRINAFFAHARILDGNGEYREAFESFQKANELARADYASRGIEYDPPSVERRFAKAVADYPHCVSSSNKGSLPIEISPIFIVGLPRSGTTLIEQILASHHEVQAAGEVLFARECEERFRESRASAGRSGAVDPGDPVDAGLLEAAREEYLDKLSERGLDASWILDKLPANFEIAGFLRLMFPGSAIVHSIRDPRATCFSLYRANFGAHEPWYYDLESLAHYYKQYWRLMGHWRNVLTAPFVEVEYEELVRDPSSQIPALLHLLGLPFDAACLEHYRHERPIFTASHAQVRNPIYTNAVDHWRKYEEWLGPLRHL